MLKKKFQCCNCEKITNYPLNWLAIDRDPPAFICEECKKQLYKEGTLTHISLSASAPQEISQEEHYKTLDRIFDKI